jgi:hypothetical protein
MIVISRGQLAKTYRRTDASRYCGRTLFERVSNCGFHVVTRELHTFRVLFRHLYESWIEFFNRLHILKEQYLKCFRQSIS